MEQQVGLAALPAAVDDRVPRSPLRNPAVASCGYKLLCLRIQVRKVASERDKARLDLERAQRRCLRLGREVDEQHVALEHTQSKLKDFQAELEAKEQLLQEAVSHQVKLEAEAEFLQGKEASLQGRLNHTMKENSELQNKVTEMAEKLAASEQLVLELQRELSWLVKDKASSSVALGREEPHGRELGERSERFAELVLEYERQCQVLWEQNGVLQRELQRLQESKAGRELPAAETSLPVEQLQEQLQDLKVELETKINYYRKEVDLMRRTFERERKDSEESFRAEMGKLEEQKRDLKRTVAKAELCQLLEENTLLKSQLGSLQQELRLAEGSEHHGKQALGREMGKEQAEEAELRVWSEKSKVEVSQLNVKMCQLGSEAAGHQAGPGTAQLQRQRPAEAEWLRRAEMATKLEQPQQHAACRMEVQLLQQQLRALQEELSEAKASLSLAQTQHALQLQQAKAQVNNMVPKKQFEQLQNSLREEQCKAQHLQEDLSQQAQQAHRQLVRTQAQLSRNKLLIEDLQEENRRLAAALQAAELKQRSTEERNQLLEEQASALKQLIGTITPASLSG